MPPRWWWGTLPPRPECPRSRPSPPRTPSATSSGPTAADAGTRDFTAVVPTPGDQTIRATDALAAFSCQETVSIVSAQFFALTFGGTEAWAGTSRPATVQAQNALGAPIANYAGTIVFS